MTDDAAIAQLADNVQQYSASGKISLCAVCCKFNVIVDINDNEDWKETVLSLRRLHRKTLPARGAPHTEYATRNRGVISRESTLRGWAHLDCME